MGTLKTSETLDVGFVTSDDDGTQNPVMETLPGASEAFYLGDKSNESVSALTREKGGSGIEAVDAKFPEPLLATVASAREDGSGIGVCSRVDGSIKGISLFVQLTGGVKSDGLNCLDENVLLSNESNGENSNSELIHENEGGPVFGHRECGFSVGEFVWAVTKNRSWWPGIVCDASCTPKEATKVQRREGSLLVRCFGSGNYVWCLPSQLKPFIEYFEQFSKQSNSKSFVGALEKAVAEFGRRVKTEFTCSCFSKKAVDGRADLSDFSVNQFEPAKFVDYIKDLAREISRPSKIESTVNQNRLSAFYHALGHCQIPVHRLKPASDAKDNVKAGSTFGAVLENKVKEGNGIANEDTVAENNKDNSFSTENGDKSNGEKSEKPYESRERRKSRFLSYPYVDLKLGVKGSPISGELRMEDPNVDFDRGADLTNTNGQSPESKVKKSRKKSSKKHDISGIGAEASVCASDVLSEVQCAAVDCLFPNQSKRFEVAERFISGYRTWAFNDFTSKITIERTVGQEFNFQMHPHQIFPEMGVQSVKGTGMEYVNDVTATAGTSGKDAQAQPSPPVISERGKKKAEAVLSPVPRNTIASGPVILDFQNGGSVAPEAQSMANKRKKDLVADQGLHDVELMQAVPDLSRNSTILHFGDPQVPEPVQCQPESKRRKKNEASDASMHAWNSNFISLPYVNGHVGLFSIQTIPQQNQGEGLKGTTALHLNNGVGPLPGFTVNNGEPQLGTLVAGDALEPRKRGRKRKTTDLQANAASTIIPDLNGNGAENNPPKKKGRRSKRKQEIGVPCIELCYNKVQQDGKEVTGTALLLKFSADHRLPSNEDLNSVFCKYGALNESETQVINGNLSGQVVFLNPSHAGEAFRCLEKDSPFGPALVNYRVQHLSARGQAADGFKTPIKIPLALKPPRPGEAPDLAKIRKNLEMMTSALEKAGDSLSPETRAKLEGEIKGLMNKVSAMAGSSSS